jgi:hypothetical protein
LAATMAKPGGRAKADAAERAPRDEFQRFPNGQYGLG